MKKNIPRMLFFVVVAVIFSIMSGMTQAQNDFMLGVEYAQNGVYEAENKSMAEVYNEMGAILIKPIDNTALMSNMVGDVNWQNDLNPLANEDVDNACNNVDAYNWSRIDDLVLEYQAAGFDPMIVLSPSFKVWDPWPWRKANIPPSMYSEIEQNCYQNYVSNIVERYDMDGIDDMPDSEYPDDPTKTGLLRPIRYWQIEEEYQTGFFDNPVGSSVWKDAAEEYIRLLTLAKPAIDAAYSNPDPENYRQIISIPLQMRGIFWNKSEQEIDDQIANYINNHKTLLDDDPNNDINIPRGPRAILDLLLKQYPGLDTFEELVDIVSFNSIDDWKAGVLAPTRFVVRMMEGYDQSKPIWISDLSYSVDPMLYLWGFWSRAVPPYVDSQVSAIKTYLKILNEGTYGVRAPNPSNPDDPDDPENQKYQEYLDTLTWHFALQSRFTAKSIVIAMGEGAKAMNVFSTTDWGFRRWPAYHYVGTFGWCGLVDVTNIHALETASTTSAIIGVGEDINGDGTIDVNYDPDADPRRPVYYMIQDLMDKLSPYGNHKRTYLDNVYGVDGTIFAYEFSDPDVASPTILVWYEDGKGQLPNDAMPEISNFRMTIIGANASNVAIRPIITERTSVGPIIPDKRGYEMIDGEIQFMLDKTPVLIYLED